MNEHHNYKLTDFIFTFITFIADFRLVSIICQSLSHSFPLSGDRELTTAGNVKACFHRRNFPKELGTLGSVCFHRRNQDLNKVPGKNLPLTACLYFFQRSWTFGGGTWTLNMLIGWVHAALYFNHHLFTSFSKYYGYCVRKCSFKSISDDNVV